LRGDSRGSPLPVEPETPGAVLERSPLKILSLATVYPNEAEPTLGVFIRWRLQKIAERCQLRAIAPRPLISYGRIRSFHWKAIIGAPRSRGWEQDGLIKLVRPRWLYFPGGGVLNSVCLFLRTLPIAWLARRQFRFDLVDAHFGHPEGVAACFLALLLGCPFVVTLRGNEMENSLHLFRRIAISWALRRSLIVIAVARNLRDLAVDLGVPADRVRVIPNGINREIFRLMDYVTCRKQHQIPDDSLLIISPGALISRKGHDRVIAAIPSLLRLGIKAQLWIVGGSGGETAFESRLYALPKTLGIEEHVRFFGPVKPEVMAQLMCAANLVCLATSREGWPNVINEALACGTPVVATETGGIKDMIPDERYGLVVPIGDSEALQRSLVSALGTHWDRQAISEWGRSRSWDDVADEVVRECRAALERQMRR